LRRRGDLALIAALLLPYLVLLLFVHPIQGIFRDVDVFVPAGAAMLASTAWLAAESLRGPGRGGLALGAAAIAIGLGVGPVVHLDRAERGVARITSWLAGPPRPSDDAAASAWSFLGWKAVGDRRWTEAAADFEHAAHLAPNPRYFAEWG